MPDILLATINAKFIHASFGLRCLRANLGVLRENSVLAEFTLEQRPLEIAERILARSPKIVGLGVYIWNASPSLELVALLKRIAPEVVVVLGGPEVSYETEEQEIARLADYVVTGEADLSFAALCGQLLAGERPGEKIIRSPVPELSTLSLPYDEYTDEDIEHRLIYVEASRGCPFSCEFCLSSLDIPVRTFPQDAFLSALQRLLDRGVLHFKFVDRTFNLSPTVSRTILGFFLERLRPGLFLHFEMVPDRMSSELLELLGRFPAGSLQLEVGVQTFNEQAAAAISRRQDYRKLEANLRYLRSSTQAHVHADLIAGLPGEDAASFARGFDRLLALEPQEIQLGILKRLRGTPISRHDEAWGMRYSAHPPYEILRNRLVDFDTMQRLRRFAKCWDLVANSGNFVESARLLREGEPSAFDAFARFADRYYAKEGKYHAVALVRTMERVLQYLVEERLIEGKIAAGALWRDYQRGGRGEMPPFLRKWLPDERPGAASHIKGQRRTALRQEKHSFNPTPRREGP